MVLGQLPPRKIASSKPKANPNPSPNRNRNFSPGQLPGCFPIPNLTLNLTETPTLTSGGRGGGRQFSSGGQLSGYREKSMAKLSTLRNLRSSWISQIWRMLTLFRNQKANYTTIMLDIIVSDQSLESFSYESLKYGFRVIAKHDHM